MESILLIDDNEAYCKQVQKTLVLRDINLHYFTDGEVGVQSALQEEWGVVLLDVFLNQPQNGLQILKRIVESKPHIPVIMISGASTLQIAVEATKKGAYDFLEKPLDVERLVLTIKRALEKNKLTTLKSNLLKELGKQINLIGKSESIKKIYSEVSRIAPTDAKVLICGESGVGKDIVAKLIHYQSKRESGPFISLNCAAIPQTLIDTELFGYCRGAFTGAEEDTAGLINKAEKGTLFLDEIVELPVQSQAKLLHFLNNGQYSPVGSTSIIQSNVRIVAATNKNLEREIQLGRFREDLYYRLNMVQIIIPPLRERVEDIIPLCEFFLQKASQKFGRTITHFSPDALDLITGQMWNGNVRQLKAAVYRMVLFANSNVIDYGTAVTAIQMDRSNEIIRSAGTYDEALNEFEKLYFINLLNTYNWELEKVALVSGLDIGDIRKKLDLLEIEIITEIEAESA